MKNTSPSPPAVELRRHTRTHIGSASPQVPDDQAAKSQEGPLVGLSEANFDEPRSGGGSPRVLGDPQFDLSRRKQEDRGAGQAHFLDDTDDENGTLLDMDASLGEGADEAEAGEAEEKQEAEE